MIPKNEQTVAKFKDFLRTNGYSPETVVAYASTLQNLLKFCEKHYDKVSKEDVEAFKAAWIKGKFSIAPKAACTTSGLKRQVAALRNFYEIFLEKDGIIKRIKIRGEKTEVVKVYSKKQVKALFAACENELEEAVLALGYYWGLRNNEVVNIRREKIDFVNSVVVFKGKGQTIFKQTLLPNGFYYAQKVGGRKNYSANIPNLLQYETKSGFKALYPHKIRQIMRRICIKAQVPYLSYHALRHSIATHLRESGWEPREVQEYLRHKNITTTMLYDHKKSDAVEKKGFKL